jgi:hypothetical protein
MEVTAMTMNGQINTNLTATTAWQGQIDTIRAQCGCGKPKDVDLNAEIGKLLTAAGELFKNIGSLLEKLNCQPPASCQPAPCQPPRPQDGCHPSGSLKVDDKGVVTTPGGYKIEQMGQFEWKVTGPDCKTTRVWGDPHVDEGDGGKWDFKRDSTFVLGDGTRINVSTAPWGNMTVTKQLEIISGNDRVVVADIDKGKGKVGQVTKDGFANVNSFGNKDVFVMGRETDDWSFQGKEVIGSENGGESFKLGNALEPLVNTTNLFGGGNNWANAISTALPQEKEANNTNNIWDPRARGKQNREMIGKALEAIGGIFTALSQILQLSTRISLGRYSQNLN